MNQTLRAIGNHTPAFELLKSCVLGHASNTRAMAKDSGSGALVAPYIALGSKVSEFLARTGASEVIKRALAREPGALLLLAGMLPPQEEDRAGESPRLAGAWIYGTALPDPPPWVMGQNPYGCQPPPQ